MKIGIVGAGAMGSVYGGLFAAAGHTVWLVDPWREHIEAIRRNGLHVSGASGERTVRPDATTTPGEAGCCDLVVRPPREPLALVLLGHQRARLGDPEELVGRED